MNMPDGTVSVNQGDIDAQAKNLADIKNELERVINAARTQVQNLVDSGGFRGASGESFKVTQEEWTVSTLKSVSLLDEMATYLTKAGGAFQEVDQAYTLK